MSSHIPQGTVHSVLGGIILLAATWVVPISSALAVNLITNGNFEGGWVPDGLCDPLGDDQLPTSWSCDETFSGGGPEISLISLAPDNGPSQAGSNAAHFARVDNCHLSGDWTTIEQAVGAHVSTCQRLTLTMDVKLIPLVPPHSHNLGGSGHVTGPCDPSGFEYPVTVVVFYTDTSNAPQCWQYGWYQYDITQANRTDAGCVSGYDGLSASPDPAVSQQIAINTWVANRFELLNVIPNVRSIDRIRIGGSGWSFDSEVDNVQLTCVPAAVPAASPVGLGVAILALLGAASWQFSRRRNR